MNKLTSELAKHLFEIFFSKMEQKIPPIKIDDDGELLIGKITVGQVIFSEDALQALLLEIAEEKIVIFRVKSGPWMYIRQENNDEVEFKISSKSQWIVANNYIQANTWAGIEKIIDLGFPFVQVTDLEIKELKNQIEKVL